MSQSTLEDRDLSRPRPNMLLVLPFTGSTDRKYVQYRRHDRMYRLYAGKPTIDNNRLEAIVPLDHILQSRLKERAK